MSMCNEDGRKFLLDRRDSILTEIERRSGSSAYQDQFIREVFECALKELDDQLKLDPTH